MKHCITILFLIGIIYSCDKKVENQTTDISLAKEDQIRLISKNANTIKTRFSPPKNFEWVEEKPHSFGYFIENFNLKTYGSPILKYDNKPIATQNLHEAVFDIDTGSTDLQQCADAIIRLKAEYLYKNKRFDDIKFHFTSGDLLSWNDYKNGKRAFVNGNSVSYRKTSNYDDSYQNFRNYLDLIFTYAGTISLNQYETKPVIETKNLKTGDILITPGSPGHIVFIAGVAQNKKGKKLFLLGEGFTPAQSIHILSNPFHPKISPWYELNTSDSETKTARYFFQPTNFRSF